MKLPYVLTQAALLALSLPALAQQQPSLQAQPVAPTNSPDPRAHSIPGYYDPGAGSFTPLAAPTAPQTTPQNTSKWRTQVVTVHIIVTFGSSSPLDYPTIQCTASMIFSPVVMTLNGSRSVSGTTEFDPSRNSRPDDTTHAANVRAGRRQADRARQRTMHRLRHQRRGPRFFGRSKKLSDSRGRGRQLRLPRALSLNCQNQPSAAPHLSHSSATRCAILGAVHLCCHLCLFVSFSPKGRKERHERRHVGILHHPRTRGTFAGEGAQGL